MIMATNTLLQRFLIVCGRTSHAILLSDQEGFLTALLAATVASKNGDTGAQEHTVHNLERAHRTLFCGNQNTQGADQA